MHPSNAKKNFPMTLASANDAVKNIGPQEAWELLQKTKNATLIDVRTLPEWNFIGAPDLTSLHKELRQISWRLYPQMQVNQDFIQTLQQTIAAKDTPVIFMCRSGGRSLDAALASAQAGYSQCYNIEGGFEGEPDAHSHRGTTSGWKAAGLPWRQM